MQNNLNIFFSANRRMGYIVDLEERRGKDEQRVDEGLHLWIYKVSNSPYCLPYSCCDVHSENLVLDQLIIPY